MLCSDFPPGFCTIPRHSTALAKSAGPLSFGVNGHTQLGNLIKISLGKKPQQEQDHPFSWKSHQGDDDGTSGTSFGYQDYTNKCRRISLMAACTPLIFSIGAVYLWQDLQKEEWYIPGTFFSNKTSLTTSSLNLLGGGTTAGTHRRFTPITEMFHWRIKGKFHSITIWKNFATWSPEPWVLLQAHCISK